MGAGYMHTGYYFGFFLAALANYFDRRALRLALDVRARRAAGAARQLHPLRRARIATLAAARVVARPTMARPSRSCSRPQYARRTVSELAYLLHLDRRPLGGLGLRADLGDADRDARRLRRRRRRAPRLVRDDAAVGRDHPRLPGAAAAGRALGRRATLAMLLRRDVRVRRARLRLRLLPATSALALVLHRASSSSASAARTSRCTRSGCPSSTRPTAARARSRSPPRSAASRGAGITFLVGAGVRTSSTIGTPVALTSIAFADRHAAAALRRGDDRQAAAELGRRTPNPAPCTPHPAPRTPLYCPRGSDEACRRGHRYRARGHPRRAGPEPAAADVPHRGQLRPRGRVPHPRRRGRARPRQGRLRDPRRGRPADDRPIRARPDSRQRPAGGAARAVDRRRVAADARRCPRARAGALLRYAARRPRLVAPHRPAAGRSPRAPPRRRRSRRPHDARHARDRRDLRAAHDRRRARAGARLVGRSRSARHGRPGRGRRSRRAIPRPRRAQRARRDRNSSTDTASERHSTRSRTWCSSSAACATSARRSSS